MQVAVFADDDGFHCDNLDLKSTPEGLNKKFEVNLITAWGMTETSPLLTTYINQEISNLDQNIEKAVINLNTYTV